MSFINFAQQEVTFKIVYYGPALCGKTTNVERIHSVIAPENRGEMTVLSTKQDRTLFFDFLPLRSAVIPGYACKFQVYTVPGQVLYNQTRKLVLHSVDGIIFVADSQWDRMADNVESFANLEANLKDQGNTLDKMPYVLQFNKRDLSNIAPSHYLDFLLNQRAVRVPAFDASAITGVGVLETLNVIAKLIIVEFVRRNKTVLEVDVPDDVAVPESADDPAGGAATP